MLKIKFKQYGVFKKQLNSSLNSLTKFFYNSDAGRIQNSLASNKTAEKKPNATINNINTQNKFPDQKIRILNNRRTKNFLKEDEESFRQKQEFLQKEKEEKSDLEEEPNPEDEDSFLNFDHGSTNKNKKPKVNNLTEKNYAGVMKPNDTSSKDLTAKQKSSVAPKAKEAETKVEIEKNFKTLVTESYKCLEFLNKFSPKELDEYCLMFIKNIFAEGVGPQQIVDLLHKAFDSNYKNLHLNQEQKQVVAKKIFESLLTIFEFMDRGMKGFLSGDLSYQLIKNAKEIIEKYHKELEDLEKNFTQLGLDPKDFYDSFFKIDKKFYTNNSTKNITFDYNMEGKSTIHPSNTYVVNLKVTQFFDSVQKQINIKDKINVRFEDVKNIIDKEKHKFHNLFNDMYNAIFEATVTNKLKTPVNGILYPQKENKHNLFRRQLILEDHAYESSLRKFKENFLKLTEISKTSDLSHIRSLTLNFHRELKYYIASTQKSITTNASYEKKEENYLKYFLALKAEDISILCIMNFMDFLNEKITKKDNEEEINKLNKILFNEIEEKDLELKVPLIKFAEKLGQSFFRELRSSKINKTFDNDSAKIYFKNMQVNLYQFEVGKKEIIRMGTFLTYIMEKAMNYNNDVMETLKRNFVDENFKNNQVIKIVKLPFEWNKVQNYVCFNKFFIGYYFLSLTKSFSMMIQIQKTLPMIYKPLKWKNLHIGSHYLRFTPLSKIDSGNKDSVVAYNSSNTSKVMRVLDNLGNVKWRINKQVLDVVEFLWASGGNKAKIPKRFNDHLLTRELLNNITPKEKYQLLKMAQENADNHSKRSDFLIKLSIARDFAGVNEIYYPHNIDYRGRAYPISPHLNHLGADLSRGLLEYAECKPLGNNGLKWMKIHLANVIGKDKLPFDKRVEYVDSIIDRVHKCAKDPYNNLEWLDSDNPFQAIATMIELSNAILSGNPETFKSNLHVHVDGSCNGLQHYSALGRDFKGGYEVNLINRDRPGDVYSKVLDFVLGKIDKEIDPNYVNYAAILKSSKCVTRKTIKQTVMTSVYGVTLVGARDQIEKQLKEMNLDIDRQMVGKVSMYLAKITIESIGDLFKEANQIKNWLTKCALIVSQSGNTVKWITPLGLPCVQPYKRITEKDVIKTINWGVTIASDYMEQPVNERKQGSAFPPNFIHSLDSSHMMYTCLKAKEIGLNFASVHDSFWSHACDIETLNKILREEFVNLYNQPLLENLLRDFKVSYPDLQFPDIPERGNLDLKEVLNSTYFFS